MVDKNNIQGHLGSLFNFASQVPYCSKHLLPLLQSSKSLIGIDPENIPENLLKFLAYKISKYEPSFTCPKKTNKDIHPEVISVDKLKYHIQNNEKHAAENYLGYLLHVADPYYLGEFLIEIAAETSLSSFLFCWSSYKSVKIMAPEETPSVLYLCLEAIMDSFTEIPEEIQGFLLHGYRHQIEKTVLLRKEKIFPFLHILLESYPFDMNYVKPFHDELAHLIDKQGDKGIHSYLNKLSIDEINEEQLYQLDGLRSAIQFMDKWRSSRIFSFIQPASIAKC